MQVARRVERVLEADRRDLAEPEDLVGVHGRLPVDRQQVAIGDPAQQVIREQRDDDREPVPDEAAKGALALRDREGDHEADDPDEDPILRVGQPEAVDGDRRPEQVDGGHADSHGPVRSPASNLLPLSVGRPGSALLGHRRAAHGEHYGETFTTY